MSFYNLPGAANAESIEVVDLVEDVQYSRSVQSLGELTISGDANVTDDEVMFDPQDDFSMKEEVVIFDGDENIESNYSTLLSMFPNVEAKYIREICVKPPFDQSEGNSLIMLINHLLSYKEKMDETFLSDEVHKDPAEIYENQLLNLTQDDKQEQTATANDKILSEILEVQDIEAMEEQRKSEQLVNEQLFAEFLEQDQTTANEKMQILESILPDADPNVLREFIEKNRDNNESLEEFVASNLRTKNYQKRDQYYAKLKMKEKVEQYITRFDVEKFIKQFPDPIEHFENPERQSTKQDVALKYLINRYKNLDDKYVEKVYESTKYNLSLADKQLQIITGNTPTTKFNIESDNTPLLQEIAFIENKTHIKEHLQVLKQEEETEMNFLRAQNLLLECQCCYNEIKPTECIECENNHIFCKKCVIKGTDLAMSNGLASVKCFNGCNNEFSLNLLRRILSRSTFEVLSNKRQEFEIKAANLDGLVNCPFCPFSMMLAAQITIFTCKNPECMKISCRMCKRINHLPIKCEDVLDEHKGRLYVEEEMSKELIRYCYQCRKPFIKRGGCNTMHCDCGANMCYICKMPANRHDHRHCQKNSEVFEREQVEVKRVQAITKLQQDFPDLKLPDIQ